VPTQVLAVHQCAAILNVWSATQKIQHADCCRNSPFRPESAGASQAVDTKNDSLKSGTIPDYPRSPDFCYGESLLEESDTMSIPQQPNIRLVNAADYRDTYANSIQIRVSVWDFLLVFGRLQPVTTQEVEVQNFQGIYLSPQQAKALLTILEQNVRQYEGTFGEIKLDPSMATQQGQIN
jgi:flagellar protein FlaG